MNTFYKRSVQLLTVIILTLFSFSNGIAQNRVNVNTKFNAQFLQLCDSAVVKLSDANSKEYHFVDSYGIRALCVAYDLTNNSKYLDVCKSWSDRMIAFQKEMIPAGGYYMNYDRKPGEKTGDWFTADCSTIGMAILATAVRCHGAERDRYMDSVEQFASLVLKNYVSPSGGITDGAWHVYNGPWWCSSGLFGSLLFNLYSNTGKKEYLQAGLKDIKWLNKQNLEKTGPLPLSHQGPSLPMYVMEAYTAGWPYIRKDRKIEEASLKQVTWCLDWILNQQKIPFDKRKWSVKEWWGSKYSGLPFHEYIFSHYLPGKQDLTVAANDEMRKIIALVKKDKMAKTQLGMFLLFSAAERVMPGAIYKSMK